MSKKYVIIQLGFTLLTILSCYGQSEKLSSKFQILNGDYAKDENYAYYFISNCSRLMAENERLNPKYWYKIEGSDGKTFQVISKNHGISHAKDKNNVYYSDDKKIEGIDVSTVQYLGNNYCRDKNFIFFRGKKYPFIDVNTFRCSPYSENSKDTNNVYHGDLDGLKILKEADVNTFIFLDETYAKDKKFIYYSGRILSQADIKTFEIIPDSSSSYKYPYGTGYAKDKKNVYYFGKIIQEVDSKTFEIIKHDNDFIKDSKNVYYKRKILLEADSETFEVISSNIYFQKDKNNVYSFGEIITGADPETFQTIDVSMFAKDINTVYYIKDKIKGSDPKTFKYFSDNKIRKYKGKHYIAEDKNNKYLGGIETIKISKSKKN